MTEVEKAVLFRRILQISSACLATSVAAVFVFLTLNSSNVWHFIALLLFAVAIPAAGVVVIDLGILPDQPTPLSGERFIRYSGITAGVTTGLGLLATLWAINPIAAMVMIATGFVLTIFSSVSERIDRRRENQVAAGEKQMVERTRPAA